jgi:threonyl-tRNA synthetase
MTPLRPEESVGSDDIWTKATAALVGALERKGWAYGLDEGGGAFYGPKIDIKIQDAIGRKWQCSTIQCDFNLPERFDLEYASADGGKQRPIMVHRAIFGSIERFFGVMIESTAGDFPLWLAPVQLRLLPVIDDVLDYCQEVMDMAASRGIRVEVDRSGNRLAKQIRNAEQEKVPLVAVVGAKEKEGRTLSVRSKKAGELGEQDVSAIVDRIVAAVQANADFTLE